MKIKIYLQADGIESRYHRETYEVHKSSTERKKEVVDKEIPPKKEGPSKSKKITHKERTIKNLHKEVADKTNKLDPEQAKKKNEGLKKVDEMLKQGVGNVDRLLEQKYPELTKILDNISKNNSEKIKNMEGVDIEKRTRETILKDVMKIKPEVLDKVEKEILEENPELKKDPQAIEALAREKILQERIKKISAKKGEMEDTLYNEILDKNKDIKAMSNKVDEKLMKELIAVYGPEAAAVNMKLLSGIDKEDLPKNLEGFDKLLREKWMEYELSQLDGDAKEAFEQAKNSDNPKEELQKVLKTPSIKKAVDQYMTNPKIGGNALSNLKATPNNFESGSMTKDWSKVQEIIDKLPEGNKAKEILSKASEWKGKYEKGNPDRQELKNFLGFDPASTPWCKGFVNAVCKETNIPYTSSLAARSGLSMGQNISAQEAQPGDLVIVSRNGGGHIGFFIGMSPNGHPMIIGGNQGRGEVSIKEEKRPVLGFRRIVPEEDAKAEKMALSGNKEGKEKIA